MTLHPAIIAHLSAQDAGLPLATCDALAALELDHGPSCGFHAYDDSCTCLPCDFERRGYLTGAVA